MLHSRWSTAKHRLTCLPIYSERLCRAEHPPTSHAANAGQQQARAALAPAPSAVMTAGEPEAAAPVGGAYYSLEDEARLQQAKATHKETTASTERSARVRNTAQSG